MHLTRRDFLAATAAATTARAAWAAGSVRHLLATAGHNRLLLKAGFITPLAKPPRLRCGARVLEGTRSDTAGLFWQFDVPGLNPRSSYQLHLADAGGRPLCDPWPLSTLPHPGARESRLRLLVYTCAGGHEGLRIPGTNDP
ncbi:MAG: hypothetical protein HYS04_13235, partial [Acidobacteria bacterium]|nr:hypothetical protein [Acidobacteriota bacterium]